MESTEGINSSLLAVLNERAEFAAINLLFFVLPAPPFDVTVTTFTCTLIFHYFFLRIRQYFEFDTGHLNSIFHLDFQNKAFFWVSHFLCETGGMCRYYSGLGAFGLNTAHSKYASRLVTVGSVHRAQTNSPTVFEMQKKSPHFWLEEEAHGFLNIMKGLYINRCFGAHKYRNGIYPGACKHGSKCRKTTACLSIKRTLTELLLQ